MPILIHEVLKFTVRSTEMSGHDFFSPIVGLLQKFNIPLMVQLKRKKARFL